MTMPPVDILIANYNGREALELCIESIAAYTPEPHRVVVHDDGSTNPGDMEYLSRARERGWVHELIDGGPQQPLPPPSGPRHPSLAAIRHGMSLNALIGGVDPETDHVVLMDNDVYVRQRGWLTSLLASGKTSSDVLGVFDSRTRGFWPRGYHPASYSEWFGLLNMRAYRDGMGIDWAKGAADRKEEPYLSYFSDIYPPESNATFRASLAGGWSRKEFDEDLVILDPGATLWIKVMFENPKSYRVILPLAMQRGLYHHWGCAQQWLNPELDKPGNDPRPTPDRPWGEYGRKQHVKYKTIVTEELERFRRSQRP